MKKFKFILFLIITIIYTTGCNSYIVAKNKNEVFYGYYNRRDLIHADVELYKINSTIVCDGMIFLNSPSRSFTFKNDKVDAKLILGCSDKRVIDANLKMTKGTFNKPYGIGIDQFDNKYSFSTVKKIEFEKNIQKTRVNNKNSNYLKY